MFVIDTNVVSKVMRLEPAPTVLVSVAECDTQEMY